jgi:hypothetical protein
VQARNPSSARRRPAGPNGRHRLPQRMAVAYSQANHTPHHQRAGCQPVIVSQPGSKRLEEILPLKTPISWPKSRETRWRPGGGRVLLIKSVFNSKSDRDEGLPFVARCGGAARMLVDDLKEARARQTPCGPTCRHRSMPQRLVYGRSFERDDLAAAALLARGRARRGAMKPATRLGQSPIPPILAGIGAGIRRISG